MPLVHKHNPCRPRHETRIRTFVFVLAMMAACTSNSAPEDSRESLLRIDEEPPGPNCEFGGTAVHAGIDTNEDGDLDDDEITETEYLCDDDPGIFTGVWHGHYVIRTALDVRFMQASEITGDLTILAGLPSLELPALRVVGGTLSSNNSSSSMALSNLTRAGSVAIGSSAITPSIDLSALVTVEGDAAFSMNGTLDISSLASVQGDALFNASTIQNVPALATVQGDLTIEGELEQVGLPMLASVTGSLHLQTNSTTLSFPRLTSVGGELSVRTAATSLEGFPVLISVGALDIDGANLQNLSALSAIVGNVESLSISGGQLESLTGLEGITSIATDLILNNNPSLLDVSALSELQTVGGSIYILGNASLTSLAGLSSLTTASAAVVDGNPVLSVGEPITSAPIPEVTLTNNGFTALAFSQAQFTRLRIANESNLTSVAAPNLTAVVGSPGLQLLRCDVLESVSMPVLDTVSNGAFVDNPNLPACSIDALLAQLSSSPPWTNTGNDELATCP